VNPHLRVTTIQVELVCVANRPAHLDADPFELGSLQ